MSQNPPSSVTLVVKNLGHVPSFKTGKSAIIDRRTGKPRPITKLEHARWMKRCIVSFELQLKCACPTTGEGIWTGALQRFLTALLGLSMEFDDALQFIPELHVIAQKVKPGEEGAEIVIERLT